MSFWTYGLPKTWLDKCRRRLVSDAPSTSNRVNGPKHCSKLNNSTLAVFIDHFEDNSGSKKSLWVICKILELFHNPFTADGKYSLLNRRNILQHFQMQLSEKGKIFSTYFFTFYKFRFTFEHLKKNDPDRFCIFELTDSEKRG